MKFIYRIPLVLLFGLLGLGASAQIQPGQLSGVVTDKETGDPVFQILVELVNPDSTVALKTVTDFDGKYTLAPITPDTYSVKFSGSAYSRQTILNVSVPGNTTTRLNAQMELANQELQEVVMQYSRPLIEEHGATRQVIESETVNNLSSRSIGTIQAVSAGVYQADEGASSQVRGSRSNANVVFIDGVKVSGNSAIPDNLSDHEYPHLWSSRYDLMDREKYNENPVEGFSSPLSSPLSTFAMDVDRGSYFNVRRMIENSQDVPTDAVRTEEFINSFKYGYEEPEDDQRFSFTTELSACPWNDEHQVLRVTLNTRRIETEELPASNMVFLVDVSGSMSGANRLGLIQKSLTMLTDQLRPQDRIALVTYAGSSRLVLPSTSGEEKEKIKNAINSLVSGGSTNGAGGITQAYAQAEENFIEGGSNRVILCTDGDFNVGVSSQSGLIDMIQEKLSSNIFLSVIGVGQGNYQEGTMEQLANKGNGNFNYFSNLYEAKKVFVEEFSSTLFTVAKDAKVQVEFNPMKVKNYRLLGYENRAMADEDFHDDTKDGGEVGAGHQVTMLYEIIPGQADEDRQLRYSELAPTEVEGEIATVSIRYKMPEESTSALSIHFVEDEVSEASSDQLFSSAVAAFAGLLREDPNMEDVQLDDVIRLAREGKGADMNGDRGDFIQLAQLYGDLTASR